MPKRLIWLLAAVLLAGALVGCQAATPTQVASQPTPVPATATQAPTATPEPTVPPATATPTEPPATKDEATPTPRTESTSSAGTRADPTPTPVWQIPEIRSGEWGKGNPEAKMVLVEYSDFQ
jgi:hypothetical protein